MKKTLIIFFFLSFSVKAELSGFITLQTLNFTENALADNQLNNDASISIQTRYTKDWNKGNDIFTADVFGRMGSQDDEKNHTDIRELTWLHVANDYEWRLGINTIFWGVTESQNLVDIINQKDAVEGIDNEKKLGQPMLHLTAVKDWGVIEGFVLLGFRERTFAGEEGRPRTPLVVATDDALFESNDGDGHIDFAIRYSHYYEELEYALSWFKGTQREPALKAAMIDGDLVLQPYYAQISQIGIEAQTIIEAWLWKFEGIAVDSDEDDYSAITTGFEYSFYGVLDSSTDIGTIVEYLYDSRGGDAPTPFNRDLFLGARVTFNDIQSSSILAGMIIDTVNHTRLVRVEVERRLGDQFKFNAEVLLYGNIDNNDILNAFRQDNALKMELTVYF